MVFSLVLMWFVQRLFLVLFTKRIFLEMFENIFLIIKYYLLDKRMIATFLTNRCIFLLAKHIVMFWKMHGECSFRASREVKLPKFPKVTLPDSF